MAGLLPPGGWVKAKNVTLPFGTEPDRAETAAFRVTGCPKVEFQPPLTLTPEPATDTWVGMCEELLGSSRMAAWLQSRLHPPPIAAPQVSVHCGGLAGSPVTP